MKKLILLLVATTFFSVGVNAQDVLTTEDMNSVYKKEKHHNKRVQQYAPLRQACGLVKFGEKLICVRKLIILFIILKIMEL